jgi:hypothetical protein
MSDAEVMTTALTAALFFRGTLESVRMMLKQHGYIPQMLSKSHFIRRLHRLKETFLLLFNWLRVLDTAERPQIDQGIGQQLHPIMSLLDAFKSEQQPL